METTTVSGDWAMYFKFSGATNRGWIFKDASNNSVAGLSCLGQFQVAGDVRAPVFYDANNTSYYLDPASTSYLNNIYANTSYITFIYDRDNTSYYLNPAGTSVLQYLNIHYYLQNTGSSYGGFVAFADDIVPTSSGSYNLGNTSYRWNQLWLNGVVYLNGFSGTAGLVLTSNGSGAAYWSTPSGGGSSTWTDAGNYQYPNGGIGTNLQVADVQSHTYGFYANVTGSYGGYFDGGTYGSYNIGSGSGTYYTYNGYTTTSALYAVGGASTNYAHLGYGTSYAGYFYNTTAGANNAVNAYTNGAGSKTGYFSNGSYNSVYNQWSLEGYMSNTTGNTGTGYAVSSTNSGSVKGYNFNGAQYTMGVAGWNYNDSYRGAGTFGAKNDGSYWGALGYRNSGGTGYGAYYTSVGSGSGFFRALPGTEAGLDGRDHFNIGMASWGDLYGADVHGEIYGQYTEGGRYAHFSKGDNYTKGLDVQLEDNGTDTMSVLYNAVAPDPINLRTRYSKAHRGQSNSKIRQNICNERLTRFQANRYRYTNRLLLWSLHSRAVQ
jgi:hypothetical protein